MTEAMTEQEWRIAFEQIAKSDPSRRELLWLRAMARYDGEHAAALVRVDPAIKARIWFFHDVNFTEVDALDEGQRQRTYARLYDTHLNWLIYGDDHA